jgi:uncharacterized protein YukE
MDHIHVEPDQLFLTSRSFWQANYRALDQVFALRAALLRLEMTWESNTSDDFFVQLHPLLQRLASQTEELFNIGLILSRQADLWAEADQRWSGVFRDISADHPGE